MWNESMIKSFLVLAHAKSFTEAAKQTFFTQQALSKQIAKLEQELDCTLFLRLRSGLQLTPEGEVYYRAFSHAMSIIDRAGDETDRMQSGGKLVIGVPAESGCGTFWEAFMRNYYLRYPDAQVEMSPEPAADLLEAVTGESYDAVLYPGELPLATDRQLTFIRLEDGNTLIWKDEGRNRAVRRPLRRLLEQVPIFLQEYKQK